MSPTASRESVATEGAARRPIILAVLGCCFLVVMMDNTILNVALRSIQRSLSANNAQLQWAVDSYILVYAALMFSAGVLADRIGRRRVLIAGMVLFAAASALSGFAHTPEQLIFWRAVMGIGGAVVPPTTLALIKDAFPASEQGKAMAVWSALGGVSVAFGPILGGFLLEHFWWGSVFLINVPVVIVCVVVIVLTVPESRVALTRPFDAPGVLLSIAGTAALVYGVIRAGELNDFLLPSTGGVFATGVALLAALVVVEGRRQAPALDVRLFRNGAFSASTLSVSIAFLALTGGTFLLVFYLQLVRGYTPLGLGLTLLPVAVGSVGSAVASAGLVRRFGPRAIVVLGLLCLAASMLGLRWVGADTALLLIEVLLLSSGLGMGFVMATTTPLAMSVVADDQAAMGAAVNNTIRQIGAALGVAVLGSLYSVWYRADLGDAVDRLPFPAAIRDDAAGSFGATVVVVERGMSNPAALALGLDRAGPAILGRAEAAFLSAMHDTVLVAAVILLAGAVVAAIWVPRRVQP
jgi:EmrB/QacA subfamily drug resistance transporter